MDNPRQWSGRLKRLWGRREQERRLDEELGFHIDQQIAKNVRAGMTPAAARRDALRRFGSTDFVRDEARDELRPALLEDLGRDIRFGVRTLVRSRGFALVAILTLGLGIGAATAVFTVVDGVLLRSLPYPDADRIVRLQQVNGDGDVTATASWPNYQDWRGGTRSYSAMATYASWDAAVIGGGQPTLTRVASISREFFDVFGARPTRGRLFRPEEQQPGGTHAAIVSDAYWRDVLGGGALEGQTLRFNDAVFQVVGVMPAGFDFPTDNHIWVPAELEPPNLHRTGHNYRVIGRLASGVPLENARRELSSLSRALKQRWGDETWMSDAAVTPLQDVMTQGARPALLVLLGAAGLLLLIACANVSNLLLVRASGRGREIALRLAIGAGRGRLLRQLVTESMVLGTAAGALGVLIAYWGVRALLALQPGNLPRVAELGLDGRALAFALGTGLLTALVLGVITSMRTDPRGLRSALTEGQRSVAGARVVRARTALVVAQMALSLMLLVGAGLLARSFLLLLAVDPGYRTRGAIVLDVAFPYPASDEAMARQATQQEAMLMQLRRLPGIDAAGVINTFPVGGSGGADGTFLELTRPDEIRSYEDLSTLPDAAERSGYAAYRIASAGYFEAMGIPLLSGRSFEEGDKGAAPHVALVSKSLAEARWSDRDPLGRFIQFGNMDGDLRAFRVIGVVGDVREHSPEADPQPMLYADYRQRPRQASQVSFVLHGAGSAPAAAAAQRIVRAVNPDVPVQAQLLGDAFERGFAGRRFSLVLLGAFAVTALVLATMGIYGVISYVVAQRTREIGIRMALGARAIDVLRGVLANGARLAGAGIVIGVIGALVATRFIRSMLYGVSATDTVSFVAVALLLSVAALFAALLPARRAARVAPAETLRAE